MKQITMNLDENHLRPITELSAFYEISALIDTGADFPVWIGDKEVLEAMNAVPLNKTVYFTGFGGSVQGELYRLDLIFGSSLNNSIIYNKMPIIACDQLNSTNYQIILPATIFENMVYQIDNINHKLNIDIPDGQVSRNLGFSEEGKGIVIYSIQDNSIPQNET